MISFESDYNNGCHEAILKRLIETNNERATGYGLDDYCTAAKEKIRLICDKPEADVFFLVGGTQTNATVIDAMLHSYQGVLSVETGHINVHESGAIEFGGHKVLVLPSHDGKMDANELNQWLQAFYDDIAYEHMVFPGIVYITFATEMGTIYTLDELRAISDVCKQYDLPLFVDGARLGYGLMAEGCDVSIQQLADLCDVFYLGGTKCGALCGEAVVFPHHNAPAHFFTIVKQHGALLAKGRLLGIQFDVLMQDNLYFKIAHHAVEQAMRLRDAFIAKGYEMYSNSPTNQQFVLLDRETIERLEKDFVFEQWFPVGEKMNCRFVTSWATLPEDVDALIAAL
ncbi:MAG: aminotransferase class I/II-fold pyridoxal phosphate-dependent enzyme [Muribaculaceae bacterium]|nr:aminotransferase class I/II-fold pyridoxal phosphate-dependent enzyme [Muribaculaceae bacterium]